MVEHWTRHFKYYDLFQNNSDRYNATVRFHLDKLKNQDIILDTGAGTGNLTLGLLNDNHKVVAIDKNNFALRVLKEKCKLYNSIQVCNLDVENISLTQNYFDGAASMFVIPFVDDTQRYFNQVYEVLKKGGKFSISAWAPVKDVWYGLAELLAEELTKKGILPKHQPEFDFMSKSSIVNAKTLLDKEITLDYITQKLENSNFKNVEVSEDNPYSKYAYMLTCVK